MASWASTTSGDGLGMGRRGGSPQEKGKNFFNCRRFPLTAWEEFIILWVHYSMGGRQTHHGSRKEIGMDLNQYFGERGLQIYLRMAAEALRSAEKPLREIVAMILEAMAQDFDEELPEPPETISPD